MDDLIRAFILISEACPMMRDRLDLMRQTHPAPDRGGLITLLDAAAQRRPSMQEWLSTK